MEIRTSGQIPHSEKSQISVIKREANDACAQTVLDKVTIDQSVTGTACSVKPDSIKLTATAPARETSLLPQLAAPSFVPGPPGHIIDISMKELSEKNLHPDAEASPIVMYPKKNVITQEELLKACGNEYDTIFACDFPVRDIWKADEMPGGYRNGKIINIDHHSPTERMEKKVTSTELAMDYVRQYGTVSEKSILLINHADCDSVLAGAVLRGIIPCDRRFINAAVAADHTGGENDIADLLQSFDFRNNRDTEFCLRNLKLFLNGEEVEKEAEDMLRERKADREEVKQLVKDTKGIEKEKVPLLITKKRIDTAFLPPLLPEAHVIVTAYPLPENPSKWGIKLRLGSKAQESFSLSSLPLPEEFGGRWDAYSNTRGGGSSTEPEALRSMLEESLNKLES